MTRAPNPRCLDRSSPMRSRSKRCRNDPALCGAVAKQIRAAATSVRLAAVEQDRRRLLEIFRGDDRTSELARQFIEPIPGQAVNNVGQDQLDLEWNS